MGYCRFNLPPRLKSDGSRDFARRGVSSDLNNLLSTSANTWSLAASTASPLFTGGRLAGHHKEGKANYYEMLEAQQQLFSVENTLSRIEAGHKFAVVQLYKALGSGWSLKGSEWSGNEHTGIILS